MQIKQKKSHKKLWIALAIVAVIVIGISIGLFAHHNNQPNDRQDSTQTAKEDGGKKKSDNKDQDKSTDKNNDSNSNNQSSSQTETDDRNGGKTPVQYEGTSPNRNDSLTGSITFASANNDTLQIRTNIDQLLESGTCQLNITGPNGQTYTSSTSIVTNPSSSTCSGFDVPLNQLGANSGGKWNLVINLSSGDKAGTITGEVNL